MKEELQISQYPLNKSALNLSSFVKVVFDISVSFPKRNCASVRHLPIPIQPLTSCRGCLNSHGVVHATSNVGWINRRDYSAADSTVKKRNPCERKERIFAGTI